MQRGGFNIKPLKETDFRYTLSNDRKIWAKNVFPIAEYILAAIQNIPWSTYSYTGTSKFWRYKDGMFRPEHVEIQASMGTTAKYFYFGGCVYEIMDKLYKDELTMPKLHDYVDPTGDLDVILLLPELTFPSSTSASRFLPYFFEELPPDPQQIQLLQMREKLRFQGKSIPPSIQERIQRLLTIDIEPRSTVQCKDDYNASNKTTLYTVRDSRRYSRWIEDYTDWVMERLAENLERYKKGSLFNSLFGNTVPFNIDNNPEGRFADRVICVGNLKIARVYLYYMNAIKIQLIAKFKDMEASDHICEFILTIPNTPNDYKMNLKDFYALKKDYHILKGVPLSNFTSLIHDNLDSLINRYSLAKTDKRHKFYNHVGRMQYIHDFLSKRVNPVDSQNPKKITMSPDAYKAMALELANFVSYVIENYYNETIVDFSYDILEEYVDNPEFLDGMSFIQYNKLKQGQVDKLIKNYGRFLVKPPLYSLDDEPRFVVDFQIYKGKPAFSRGEFEFQEIFDIVYSIPNAEKEEFGFPYNGGIYSMYFSQLMKMAKAFSIVHF